VAATIGDAAIKNPDGCLVSWDGAKLYVAAAGGHSVFVFDTKDAHKLSQIEVGDEPRRLLFSADGSKLYVSKGSDPYVSVVDVRTEKVVGKIRAGRDARPMAWMPDGKYLAIANVSDDTVEFVKPGETQPEYVVGVPKSPQRLVVVPSKQILFAIGRVDGVLSLLDIRPDSQEYGRVMATIAVGKAPWGLALSAAGDSLYVTNTADNTVSIVDLRLMRTTFSVPTGKAPLGLAVR
jgi:YVTN family beta-propeller protein